MSQRWPKSASTAPKSTSSSTKRQSTITDTLGTKKVKFVEEPTYETEKVDSTSEEEPKDRTHLLGLREWIDYDPSTPMYVKMLNETEDDEIVALMEITHHRIQALRTRARALELKQSSIVCVEAKAKYAYAWIKGAEAAGVYKLKPN